VENGEDYLSVLSQHRMTDDSRVRLWASGRDERLPASGGQACFCVIGARPEALNERPSAKAFELRNAGRVKAHGAPHGP
jgi:hypothetical protein